MDSSDKTYFDINTSDWMNKVVFSVGSNPQAKRAVNVLLGR